MLVKAEISPKEPEESTWPLSKYTHGFESGEERRMQFASAFMKGLGEYSEYKMIISRSHWKLYSTSSHVVGRLCYYTNYMLGV